jgi:hypothetical protein
MELCVFPATKKKVETVSVSDQASPPFSPCLLPHSEPALMRCFSHAQELLIELDGSSPVPARDGNDVNTPYTTYSKPDHATATKLSFTSPPPIRIIASLSNEP